MNHRFLDLRFLLLASLIASGCDCGGDALLDARAKLAVAPEMLEFGEVVRGELRVLGLELSNSGSLALKLKPTDFVSTTGEFAFVSVVPDTIAPQAKAMVNVAYTPADIGEDTGTITFHPDNEQEPIVINMHGIGVESGVGVELEGETCNGMEGSLGFGNLTPGSSAERNIHLKSRGGAPLTVLSAIVETGASGEWSIDAGALPKTVASGEELVLVAKYAPVDGGNDMATFVITTDAPSMPTIRIPACGAGIAPAICAHPVPLDLGATGAGQTVTGRLTIESCGLEALQLNTLAIATDAAHMSATGFSITMAPALPATLQPGETTEVEVSFTAQPPFGPSRAWIQASSNAPDAFFPVDSRVAAPCAVYAAPTILSFRDVALNTTATQTVLIGNSGETDCQIAMLNVTTQGSGNEFSLASPPATPLTIGAGGSITVDVAFTPVAAGLIDGALAIVDAGGGTTTVELHGNPPEAMGCFIEAQPTVLSFGVTAVGTLAHMGIRVVNVGSDPCRISNVILVNGNPVFTVTPPGIGIAFPGIGGVDIDVTYAPTMAVAASDIVQIDATPLMTGTGGNRVTVGITASAADAHICVNPPSIDFGTVGVGSTASRSVIISSCGAVDLGLRGIILSSGTGGPFSITAQPTLPSSIPPGLNAMPDLTVTYAPMTAGPHFGQIEILSSDSTMRTVRVPITGNFDGSCTAVLQCAPAPIAFGATDVGTSKLIREVCRNLGNDPVTINSVMLASMTSELTLSASTPVTVQPGDAWTFDVTYAPASAAVGGGTININTTACISPPAITISGIGVDRVLPPCQPPSTFTPTVQWQWDTSALEPTFINTWSTPLVANLNDDNGDGMIDENDTPEVVFISLDTYSISDPTASIPGVLRVLNGASGVEEFSVDDPRFMDTSLLAIGDLDGDGRPEIIGSKWIPTPPGSGPGNFFGRYVTGTLVALDNTGHLIWESDPWQWPSDLTWNSSAPSIADLDGDGFAEILLGRDVFDYRGRLKWRGTGDYGLSTGGVSSIAADLDLDGHPEVIAGGTIYRADGAILLDLSAEGEGGSSVGMLDPMDPFPEIAWFNGGRLAVVDHLGNDRWSVPITSMMAATTMQPAIADFDGDGNGDIAIANGEAMYVYSGTGNLIWSAPVMDSTCCAGITAFDFEGDGAYELILTDYGTVYVYRGSDGTLMYSAPRPSPTAYEEPVVADIDNDGKGELIVALFGGSGQHGVIAYSNLGDTWVSAPRIWNQQAYHVTNVYENGAIPRVETPIPQGPNVYRGTIATCQ